MTMEQFPSEAHETLLRSDNSVELKSAAFEALQGKTRYSPESLTTTCSGGLTSVMK